MKPWIRVNAKLAEDAQVRAFAKALLPDRRLADAVAAVCGLLVTLWGQLAEHRPSGDVSDCDDDQLEGWAKWWGEPGAFATLWRQTFVVRGVVQDWEEYNGKALQQLAADAKRKREARAGGAAAKRPVGRPADTSQGNLGLSGVNGDVNGDEVNNPVGERGNVETVEKLPPVDRIVRTAHGEVTFPADATRLLEAFYQGQPQRMADAARQLLAALGPGALLEKDVAVRAVDSNHLAEACRAVLQTPPRKRDLAVRFVLFQLRDTYLEVHARQAARHRATEASAREQRVAEAQRYVDGIGGLWDKIEAEVDALLPVHQQGKPTPARNLMLETAVLDAFERQRTLDRDTPFAAEAPPPAPKPVAEIPPDLLEE